MPTLFHALLALLGRPRPTPEPTRDRYTPIVRTVPGSGMVYRLGGDGQWWPLDVLPGYEPLHPADVPSLVPVAHSELAADLQPPYRPASGELARLRTIEAAAQAWAAEADTGHHTPAGDELLDLLNGEHPRREHRPETVTVLHGTCAQEACAHTGNPGDECPWVQVRVCTTCSYGGVNLALLDAVPVTPWPCAHAPQATTEEAHRG